MNIISLERMGALTDGTLVEYTSEHEKLIPEIRDLEDQLAEATTEEIQPLTYVPSHGIPTKMTDSVYMSQLLQECKLFLMFNTAGNLVGLCGTVEKVKYKDTVHIKRFVIKSEYMRQGYGAIMIRQLKNFYEKTHSYMTLKVNTQSPTVRVYSMAGFKEYQKEMVSKL